MKPSFPERSARPGSAPKWTAASPSGAQVLVVDVEDVKLLDAAVVAVLVDAAEHLHDERSGSLVLRNASVPLLGQLRLMRLDHMFRVG